MYEKKTPSVVVAVMIIYETVHAMDPLLIRVRMLFWIHSFILVVYPLVSEVCCGLVDGSPVV